MGLHESGKKYKGIIADSPFKKQNIKALITEGLDTKRENRNPYMFKKMVSRINEVLYSIWLFKSIDIYLKYSFIY